jgi:hypothetical protein
VSVTSLYASKTLRDKETYENMDALWLALAADPTAQQVLLTLWRNIVWRCATQAHRARVYALMPALWRDLVSVTWPSPGVLRRWEADHGFTNRS